jgi:hypothetical protein
MWILLLTLSVVLGLVTPAVAQVRWELLGPVSGATPTTLPPPTPPGLILRMTEGGATDALVTANGSTWNCDAARTQKIALVTCPPYNARGDGSTDDTAALQAAFSSGLSVRLPCPATYRIAHPLVLTTSNVTISGCPGSVLQLANNVNAPMLQLTSIADVVLEGLTLNGNSANQSACNGICIGINVATATRLTIRNTHIYNVKNLGIRITGALSADVSHNRIEDVVGEGNYGGGIVFTGPAANYWVIISHNIVERTGGGGIGFGLGADAVITDNLLNDTAKIVTQQSVVLGYGLDNATDTQRVLFANNIVNKSTQNGCLRMGGTDITVQGNTFHDCGSNAYFALGAATTNTDYVYGVNLRFLDNSVRLVNDNDIGGIQISRCWACEASGNRIILTPTNTVSTAIGLGQASSSSITNNRLENGRTCIRIFDTNNLQIGGNLCRGQSTSGIALETFETPSDEVTIVGNSIIEMPAGATAGIDAKSGNPTNVNITGNIVRGGILGKRVIQGPDVLGLATGNYAPGADCAVSSTATLNPNGDQISCSWLQITGTPGTITALNAAPAGRLITLEFAVASTLVDGGNLHLAGNFVASTGDTISLRSNGSAWVETGRSVN